MGVNLSRSRESDPHCSPREESVCDVMEAANESEEDFQEAQEDTRSHEQEMVEFKKELARKREQRRNIIAKHASEKENLRKSLQTQIQANETIVNENKVLRELLQQHGIQAPETNSEASDDKGALSFLMADLENLKEHNRKLHRDLADTNAALQSANSDMANIHGQNLESMKQISALKEVVAVSKTMMQIRESQLNELKAKLSQIEASLADREANLLSTDLRAEYERQLQNIRTLRSLYEERARLAEGTRLQLLRELDEQKVLAAIETNRCKELTDKVAELEVKMVEMSDTIDNKDDQISSTREETRGLKAEMSTVNKLFSQMLLGHKSHQDLDKLVSRLEEHHGILAQMVATDGAEASSAMPKLLLDLVGQLDTDKGEDKQKEQESGLNTTAEEIVGNLPKVWRVLMELLSHQSGSDAVPGEIHPSTCYKPVETSAGTRMVPSVSQTYIRLKDLIVEKLSLTKEMGKMKQLNAHLENRLEEQEKRLCLVTSELSKTWHVVGRLRRHHHQLHTHEKILRYELQQKRKMLNELKEELEYCKEKWDKAREKNTESEKEWRKLRSEFSNRKNKVNISLNNSGESGYSDERQTEDESTESNDESEYVNDPPIRCKKRIRKTFDLLADSSTDKNFTAEREDPISDSLDVTDLPLDGLELDERDEDLSTSESCISDNYIKSGNIVETTAHVPCPASENVDGDISTVLDNFLADTDNSAINDGSGIVTQSSVTPIQNSVSDATSDTLNDLLNSSASLLEQINKTDALRQNIAAKLEIMRKKTDESECSAVKNTIVVSENTTNEIVKDNSKSVAGLNETSEIIKTNDNKILENSETLNPDDVAGPSKLINPKEVMENIRKQNERLARRDERMERLENECTSLLKTSKNTLQVGTDIEAKLAIISARNSEKKSSNNDKMAIISENEVVERPQDTNNISLPKKEAIGDSNDNNVGDVEASGSAVPLDHEARFAARDERLKRLEEQTKSLVNKVNHTTNKSVRLSYKLEELHNIYGSEGATSRNQSPGVDEAEHETSPVSHEDPGEEPQE